MKIKKSLPIFLTIAIISGVTFKLAKAWTEPVTAPPSSNVGAPITTGSMDQSKSGRLYVGSILSDYVPAGGNWNYTMRLDSADTTSIGFHDSMTSVGSIRFKANNFTIGANDGWGVANTTFGGSISNYATPQYAQGMSTYVLNSNYWYPSNNSGDTMYVGINNPVISRGDLRAPIFYDYNNTNYYIDPNNGSQFNAVYANNWFRPQGDTGLYFENHGGGLNMIDNTWVRTYGVGNFYAYGESQATTVRANSNLVTPKISFTDGTVQTSAASPQAAYYFGQISGAADFFVYAVGKFNPSTNLFSGTLWRQGQQASGEVSCDNSAACAASAARGGVNVNGSNAPHIVVGVNIPMAGPLWVY
ncbi:MAG: shufflon system plasmid conjugative transfer pilus tip adhesin PilV [bacterium]